MISKEVKINPAGYEFIYKVNNFDYFFFYLLYNSEYFKWNFIFTNKGKEWKTYMQKRDLVKASKFGFRLMSHDKNFLVYREKAGELLKKSKSFLKDIKEINFSKSTDQELSKKLIEVSHFVTKLWSLYFFTELFCYSEVEKVLENKIEPKAELRKISRNVMKMQKLKYALRTEINKTIFRKHIFLSLLKEIQKRTKLRQKDINNLSFIEIVDCLEKRNKEIKNRKIYVCGKFNEWKIIQGNKALSIIKQLESYKKKADNILYGKTGNKGFYTGKVKIIPLDLKADLNKLIKEMRKGEVLVSGSTGPEMILAARKAGAIITEEGGITSHAAILSRELGIPSVIGTHIATEVLKDGDLVEVDANKGIVKIINRKK